ncbi:MAG: hypothetical protein KAY24_10975, partial [Candidatus Eisenbacteria sp.]|nr:hypothetical protein [Candidatus Eisenbacteria bacterium]
GLTNPGSDLKARCSGTFPRAAPTRRLRTARELRLSAGYELPASCAPPPNWAKVHPGCPL